MERTGNTSQEKHENDPGIVSEWKGQVTIWEDLIEETFSSYRFPDRLKERLNEELRNIIRPGPSEETPPMYRINQMNKLRYGLWKGDFESMTGHQTKAYSTLIDEIYQDMIKFFNKHQIGGTHI